MYDAHCKEDVLLSFKGRKKRWWLNPSLDDILAEPNAITKSKVDPQTIQRALVAMVENSPYATRPTRARKKWQEIVEVDGVKIALGCHVQDNIHKIVITNIKRAQKKFKYPP